MAKKLLMAVLALMAMTMQAKVNVEVAETVELLSALSRTAGYPEYNMNMGGQYAQELDSWFAPFKDHPIINYYQGLRENFGIAYNAPMDLAVNLVIDGGLGEDSPSTVIDCSGGNLEVIRYGKGPIDL